MSVAPTVARVVSGSVYVGVIVTLAAIAAWPVYRNAQFVLLVAVTVVAAAGIAWLAVWRKLSAWLIALCLTGAIIVLGVPLAVPSRMTSVPAVAAGLGDVLAGTVLGWKDLLTVELPVGNYRNLLVPALLVFLVGTCVALLLAWRSDRIGAGAVIVGIAMPFFGLLFGRTSVSDSVSLGALEIVAPVETLIGAATLLASVLWLSWRSRDERQRALQRVTIASGARSAVRGSRFDRSRAALAAAMVVCSLVVAIAVVPWASSALSRDVLRSAVGPDLNLTAEISPLAEYRLQFADSRAEEVLFTVTSTGEMPDRIRVATLDNYDGEVYRAGGESGSATFVRVPSALDAGSGTQFDLDVEINGLRGVWVPTAGNLVEVSFSGDRAAALADAFYYSQDAAAGIETADGGLETGDAYRITSVTPTTSDLTQIEAPGTSDMTVELPANLESWIEEHVSGSGGEALDGLVKLLRERGYLSHALSAGDETPVWAQSLGDYSFQPSASGHSLARIDTLFSRLLERESDPRAKKSENYVAAVGDDEQFAVAVALMAESLGFSARVVVGARLSTTDATLSTCDEGACRAADLAAWTEVLSADGQWIPIDVTPQYAQSPSLEVTEQRDPENVTEVRPDSVEEVVPPNPVQDDTTRDENSENDDADLSWLWVSLRIAGFSLLVILVLFGPLFLVAAARALRRRGRRSRSEPVGQIAGGWDELIDSAVDAGHSVPRLSTRSELAVALETRTAAALALDADRAIFSADGASEAEADAFWAAVEQERRAYAREGSLWHRVRTALSLRSFIRFSASQPERRAAGSLERRKRRNSRRTTS
ncbi:hypothetical protein FHX49_000987 [Microbacterium endophyticum]|uniref:Transglutaminase-like domain-containing protein n=1 Tax=Microbacterium endophyticum TaxID=1526412 RepID=A0A7W4V212_9MICO|nr:transglutaminase domain-containing protein [Microbacterium endophyticum]MBB2975421.1 hypothetical protein [Microbacterium endophyticum]NIK35560.1 hypothetical protein [Microbacterium endophyticum]